MAIMTTALMIQGTAMADPDKRTKWIDQLLAPHGPF
jgi:hypothetical protein